MTERLRWIAVVALLAAGCTTATPEVIETRQAPAGNLSPEKAVTVVSLVSEAGNSAAGCVAEAIGKISPGIRVIAPATFRDGMFPWFEPDTTPTTVGGLTRLMDRPIVRQKIRAFGVRYVVAVGGRTGGEMGHWGGTVAQGPGIAAAITGVHVKTTTELAAVILDLERTEPVGQVSASATGTSGAGVLLIIPYVYFGPDTEQVTCEAIAQRVVGFLTGKPRSRVPDNKKGNSK
jgi:hypothetical protein